MACAANCINEDFDCNDCVKLDEIVARLAAYEDTNLTPEEIMILCSMDRRAKMAELLRMEENKPLTLEELRGMDGEPVWLVGANDAEIDGNGYAVVDFRYYGGKDTPICFWFGNEVEMKPRVNNYGKTWLAYRRRPEEGTR